jgi:hypothetical protein
VSDKTVTTEKGDESRSRVLFFNDSNMELVGSYDLDRFEHGFTCISCSFNNSKTEYFVVGTAFAINDELECSKGRILVFDVNGSAQQRISLITEKELKAAVYSLTEICGRLAAGIGSKVILISLVLFDMISIAVVGSTL